MEKDKNDDLSNEKKGQNSLKSDSSKDYEQDLSNKENTNESNRDDDNHDNDSADLDNNEEKEIEEELLYLREEKLRLLAEMENLRKRFDKEKTELIKYGTINLVREILSPGDNLERALDAIPKDEKLPSSIKNLVDGLKMVQKEFNSILEKNGVKKINSLNQKFDHNYHQAMMEIEKDDVEEGLVVEEIQPGYTMHDRLLRPAMVCVSKPNVTINKNEKETTKKVDKNKENQEK